MTIRFNPAELSMFIGTENHYRHPIVRSVLYTDGVQHIGANGCGWLVDIVATCQALPKVSAEPFQVWTLNVQPNQTATVVCDDGNGHELYRQGIPLTDYPHTEEPLKLYVSNNVIMLPSEY